MKTSSSKAKGRELQKLVVERVREALNLNKDDISSAIMGDTGADIKLSSRGKRVFSYSVECKRRANYTTIYNFYKQAARHYPELIPLVVIRGDREKPLVILDLEHFLTVINK